MRGNRLASPPSSTLHPLAKFPLPGLVLLLLRRNKKKFINQETKQQQLEVLHIDSNAWWSVVCQRAIISAFEKKIRVDESPGRKSGIYVKDSIYSSCIFRLKFRVAARKHTPPSCCRPSRVNPHVSETIEPNCVVCTSSVVDAMG